MKCLICASAHGIKARRLTTCTHCGFTWNTERPSSAEHSAHYAETASRSLARQDAGRSRRLLDVREDLVRRYYRKDVLVVGCGYGLLLDRIDDLDPDAIDLSPIPVEEVRKRGHRASQISLELLAHTGVRYDLITAFSVLEHVHDPDEFMRAAYTVLRPGGAALFFIPDSARPDAENLSDFFSAEHLWHFTEDSFRRFLEKHGFLTEAIRTAEGPGIVAAGRRHEFAHPSGAINDYFKQREEFKARARATLSAAEGRIALFGAGEHTENLLKMMQGTPFAQRIVQVVDSDPEKQGKVVFGLCVSDPSALSADTVVLSSQHFHEEMRDQCPAGSTVVNLYG